MKEEGAKLIECLVEEEESQFVNNIKQEYEQSDESSYQLLEGDNDGRSH